MPDVPSILKTIGQRFSAGFRSGQTSDAAADTLAAWEYWSGDTIAADHAQRQRIFQKNVGNSQEMRSRKKQRLARLQTLDAGLNQLTSLPKLPEKLQELNAGINQLTSLPELPEKLQKLYAGENQLTSLPKLPEELQELDACNNQLTSLPELPEKLQKLYAGRNQLTSLPELPEKLQKLCAGDNQLASLPKLPEELQTLDAEGNQLTSLPELPEELQKLNAAINELASLPKLPEKLQTLNAAMNELTSLPELPKKLQMLDAAYNRLTSLPELPEELQALNAEGNQLTSLPKLPEELQELDAGTNQLTSLPKLPEKLQILKVWGNQLTSLPELPEKLEMLHAASNQLTRLPKLPAKLQGLSVSDNQLTRLPELPEKLQTLKVWGNQLTSLPELPEKLRTLEASNNRLRTVPPQLLRKNLQAEVDLRGNPIPREQIAVFMREIRQRRARGEKTPELIFDEALRNDPHDLGNLTDTNVHNRRLVGVFQAQLERLIKRYPDLVSSQTPFDFERLKSALLKDAQACADRHPELNAAEFGRRSIAELAEEAVESMCGQGKSATAADDFQHSAGQVLAYVYRYINDQPPDRRDAGLVQLFRHLSYARGNNEQGQVYCPTRHVEEALTALQSAYDMQAGVPFEQAREVMQKLGKDALLPLLAIPAETDATTQEQFTRCFHEALKKHPNITKEQVDRYLNEFVFAHWEAYCDVARESQAAAKSNG